MVIGLIETVSQSRLSNCKYGSPREWLMDSVEIWRTTGFSIDDDEFILGQTEFEVFMVCTDGAISKYCFGICGRVKANDLYILCVCLAHSLFLKEN